MWLHAQHGRLCAWEQAKALALRKVGRELHGRTQLAWIAARVEKAGCGHPNLGALHKFFKVVDVKCDSSVVDMLKAKHTESSQSHPGAGGSRGRSAKCDFIVADKLQGKRTEPSRTHPRTIGSLGRNAPYVGAPLTSSSRNAWSHPGFTPEQVEAVCETRGVILSSLTSLRRNARNRRGTVPEPSEAVGETRIGAHGTVRNRRRNRPDFRKAPRQTPFSWHRPAFN